MYDLLQSLNQRELDIINLIIHEYSSKQIAEKLCMSFETVRTYRKRIINKLGVKSTAGVVRKSLELGLV